MFWKKRDRQTIIYETNTCCYAVKRERQNIINFYGDMFSKETIEIYLTLRDKYNMSCPEKQSLKLHLTLRN